MAESRVDAEQAFDNFLATDEACVSEGQRVSRQ
jgi:hypothetical protein